jgi:hypothetical protein
VVLQHLGEAHHQIDFAISEALVSGDQRLQGRLELWGLGLHQSMHYQMDGATSEATSPSHQAGERIALFSFRILLYRVCLTAAPWGGTPPDRLRHQRGTGESGVLRLGICSGLGLLVFWGSWHTVTCGI